MGVTPPCVSVGRDVGEGASVGGVGRDVGPEGASVGGVSVGGVSVGGVSVGGGRCECG